MPAHRIVVPNEDDAGDGADISRQELENAVAELLDRLVSQHGGCECNMSRLQPILALSRKRGPADQVADDRG